MSLNIEGRDSNRAYHIELYHYISLFQGFTYNKVAKFLCVCDHRDRIIITSGSSYRHVAERGRIWWQLFGQLAGGGANSSVGESPGMV